MQAKLTPEHRKIIVGACDRLIAACSATAPIDRDVCSSAIRLAYRHLRLDAPEIVFVESPIAALNELKRRTRSEARSTTPSDALSSLLKALPDSIAAAMLSAQPRKTAALGDEVDLGFNDEINRALERREPALWDSVSKLIDKRLGAQCHFSNAVEQTLSEQVEPGDRWLIYSGGFASLWSSAEGLARVEALHAIGAIGSVPAGLEMGRAVLQDCGCVNAFEKVCVVSDRPLELSQSGTARGPEGIRTVLTWRDATTCELVFR